MTKIVLLTGPSSAGKTTITREFLAQQTDIWAYINQDDLRKNIASGYQSADGLRSEWSKEVWSQWIVSIDACTTLATVYQKHNINVLIDFYATYAEFTDYWKPGLIDIDYSLFVLTPTKEAILQRNRSRQQPSKLTEEKILECYQDFTDWYNTDEGRHIDNSSLSVEQVINVLQENS